MFNRVAFLAKAAGYGIVCVAAGNVTHEPIKRAIAHVRHHPAPAHHSEPVVAVAQTQPCIPTPPVVTLSEAGRRLGDEVVSFDMPQIETRPVLVNPGVIPVVAPEAPYPSGPGPITVVTNPPHPTPLPEPGTWALMIGGFGAVGVVLRRVNGRVVA